LLNPAFIINHFNLAGVPILLKTLALSVIVCTTTWACTGHAGPSSAAGPLRVHPSNPRYFTDESGRAIYLTGSHTWANFQDFGDVDPPPAFNFSEYLEFLRSLNHNFIRLWVAEQATSASHTGNHYRAPLPYHRLGPGTALDGKPKFDLSQFNQAYFDRLRSHVLAARDRGIYVSVMLFNGCSVESFEELLHLDRNPWLGHPFNRHNNINGIDGDPNNDNQGPEIHTLSEDPKIIAVRTFQEAYVRKVIDTLNDLDNVLYEIGNEIEPHSTTWQYYMINFIKAYEGHKPKSHPVGMTFQSIPGPSNAVLFSSPADWISPGTVDIPGGTSESKYRDDPPAANGSKVILSDTDHLWGVGGDWVWVWKSFLRGLNPIYMDPYGSQDFTQVDERVRKAMGYTVAYAKKINLAGMVPRSDLASTTYALANPGVEYLIYLPSEAQWRNEKATVDLSASDKVFRVEWCNPRTGELTDSGTVTGGRPQSFTAPFLGDAILYLAAIENGPQE
jgi:hypothetical protein